MSKYAKYLPTVGALLLVLANAASPAVASFWAAHSAAAAFLAPLAVVVAHWLPSPSAS